ncbi:hypothetical protein COCOBI_03-2670 [Coccomyxa sp. Obi]|nr:hypothetical protein COCOBI_03-2670 [Coccomyxa sp. Obi]
MKVYTMRDLNPLQFFRGGAADVLGDLPERKQEQPKKPMTKVPSLLFDLEMEEGQGRKEAEAAVHESQTQLEYLTEPWSAPERQLMQQVVAVCEGEAANGKAPEADAVAERLVQLGYSVTVRTALGGGGGCECLRNLRHVFICVRMPGGNGSVLVDPKFKEQFEIAHPTARYAALLDEVPACFVGTEERLVALVELLCSEMSAAFRGTGTTLPPWRQAPSMLSKWRPRRSTDERRTPAPAAKSLFTKASASASFSVNASAASSMCSPGAPPAFRTLRRSSLPARMCTEPLPAPRAASEGPALSRCRASAARTAASLLAVELGDDGRGAAAHPRRIGAHQLRSKASDEDADSPTSVLDAEQELAPASVPRWQLRESLGKANDMLRSGMRQGLVTGM